MSSKLPIGVFDSGVGGLTVVKEIMNQLPNEDIIYFGDTARLPYGNKSKETIITYTREIVDFLKEKNVKAIVIACNTASAFALETIEAEIDIPIIGVVKPGAKMAALGTRNGRIGVIGTKGTIGSKVYIEYINEINQDLEVLGRACPLFVPLIEEGLLDDRITLDIGRRYTEELLEAGVDTLVLGCTHYPLIRKTLRRIVGEDILLIDPAHETAKWLKSILEDREIINEKSEAVKYRFYVSDGGEQFEVFANTILNCGPLETKDININNL